MEHIVSACPVLAKERYLKRHDKVCAQLCFNTCKETGVKLENEHWYEHVPKLVETSSQGIIPNNNPDIKIRDIQSGACN